MSPRQSFQTAYLLSRYPALSHTFFRQEVIGLRTHGINIATASINDPDRDFNSLSNEEQKAASTTFYLKHQPVAKILSTMLRTTLTKPGVLWRGIKAVARLEPFHLTHTLYAFFYLAEAVMLGEWMRQRNLNHLHIHFSGPVASVGMIAAAAWEFPYSMTVHGPDEFFDQNEMALPQKIGGACFVICISDFCRSQLMRLVPPAGWNKFLVVRLGIAPELAMQPIRPAKVGPLSILCTGRLVGAKGQAILLMALAALIRRAYAVSLVLIGDGPDRGTLEALVKQEGMEKHVTFTGGQNHDRVLESLRGADLFVLPSFAEGIPVALMEAMAIGVPCISTFVAGIPELIRHEQDGLLVPAGSVEALTAAMERLILSPGDRTRFQQSARQRVLEHYNLPENLKLLADTMSQYLPKYLPECLPKIDSRA